MALASAHPTLLTYIELGKSSEGRPMFALILNNPKTGRDTDKPAMYIDGNIHGNEVQAGEVCLSLLNRLLTTYGQNEQMTKVVDRNAFYVIPSVNVDGRYHFFSDPNEADKDYPDRGTLVRFSVDGGGATVARTDLGRVAEDTAKIACDRFSAADGGRLFVAQPILHRHLGPRAGLPGPSLDGVCPGRHPALSIRLAFRTPAPAATRIILLSLCSAVQLVLHRQLGPRVGWPACFLDSV
jgi:hypothetical protein